MKEILKTRLELESGTEPKKKKKSIPIPKKILENQ